MKAKLRPHYSGGLSTKFWKKVNSLKGKKHELYYTAGVLLQDIEGSIVRLLNNEEVKQ